MANIATHQTLQTLWQQLSKERGNHDFLIYDDPDSKYTETWTYAQFYREIKKLAAGLSHIGVKANDNVAVQVGNTPQFLESFFALAELGATLVPLPPGYKCDECKYIIDKCTVDTIITTSDHLSYYIEPESCHPQTRFKIILLDTPEHQTRENLWSYVELKQNALVEKETPPPTRGFRKDQAVAEIMFTSGTTSLPKGVMLTHANLIFSGIFQNWQLAMRPEDRYATTMTVEHVNFQLSALMPVLCSGATLILFKRYSATTFWKSVLRHKATLVQGMAMIARTMLAQPSFLGEDEHDVRLMHYFLPITDTEKTQFTRRFNLRLLNSYGSTETLVGVATDQAFGPTRWPAVGRVGIGYQIEIRNPQGQVLPATEIGEIFVHGQPGLSLMLGYYQDPEATAKALSEDGWFATGDMGYFDEDGWLYFVDRQKNLIKRAGENISSSEVEDVLMNHPHIKEAAVIGVDDPIKDQAVAAFIVTHPGTDLTEADIQAHCSEKLAHFKVPTIVQFRTELPKSQYGKIKKSSLTLNEEQ